MAYIQGTDRNQGTFLLPSLDEYVGEDSIVRVIDAFVDGLDLAYMGFGKARPALTGRPAYDPRALLKLYIYGYTNRIRSSRKLQVECARNVEVMYLLGGLRPDFRTIADFRKDNPESLKQVFVEFVSICTALKLYDSGMLAIDGTKIRAQNSRANTYNAENLEKKLANINEHIARYLAYLDEADAGEGEVSVPDTRNGAKGTGKAQRPQDYLRGLQADTQRYRPDPDTDN